MTFRIEIGPVGNPNLTLDSGDLFDIDIAKPHTALADFEATIPYSKTITDRALDPVRAYVANVILFRGSLRDLQWDQSNGTTRIAGPGIGDDLRDSAIEVSFTNKPTWKAISDVWANHTGFSATVYEPPTEVVKTDEVIIDADTTAELSGALDTTPPTDPVVVANGKTRLAQSLHLGKDTFGSGQDSDPDAQGKIESNGEVTVGTLGTDIGQDGDRLEINFSRSYELKPADAGWAIRVKAKDTSADGNESKLPGLQVKLDGTVLGGGFVDGWTVANFDEWVYFDVEDFSDDLSSNVSTGSHTLALEQTADTDNTYDTLLCDLLVFYDNRYSYNFDNNVSLSSDGSYNYLDGPELRPDGYTLYGDQPETEFNAVGATLTTSGWTDNNTSGRQSVGISVDGGVSYTDANNATSVDVDDRQNVSQKINWRVTLDRYGSGQERTPDQGYKGQEFDAVTVDYDGTNLSVIQDNTFRGSPLSVLTDLHERATMRFVIDHAATDNNGDLTKSVESFARGEQSRTADWTVQNRQPSLSFNQYANEVTVYGKLSNGTRPKVTVQNDAEVNAYGTEPYWEIRPDATTVEQVRAHAKDILRSKVSERDQKGDLTVLPTNILPGYSYEVDWFDDGTTSETPLERVQFSQSLGQMSGTLKFLITDDVTETVINQGAAINKTRDGI